MQLPARTLKGLIIFQKRLYKPNIVCTLVILQSLMNVGINFSYNNKTFSNIVL